MNRDDFPRVESNMITPYIAPATSLALARYGSEMAGAMMPRLFPEHPLANALVPQALRYGGYAVGGYLIAKNFQIKPADILVSETAKKIAKNGLNFAPAALCHPRVAQAATATCSQLASHYLSTNTAALVQNYVTPTLSSAVALRTLYLVNRNVAHGSLIEKSKKFIHDSRPYLFMAPMLATYNRDIIKDYLIGQLPNTIGPNLKSDMNWGLDKGLLIGGVGITCYLLAFETFSIASNGYLSKRIKDLQQRFGTLQDFMSTRLSNRADKLVNNSEKLRDATTNQMIELRKNDDNRNNKIYEINGELKELLVRNLTSHEETEKIERIIRVLAQELEAIERANQNQVVTSKDLAQTIEQLAISLANLKIHLKKEDTAYGAINAQLSRISKIRDTIAHNQANSTVAINQMLNELKPEASDAMDVEK